MKVSSSLLRLGRAAVCVSLAAALTCGCAAPRALFGLIDSQTSAEALPYDTSKLADGKLHMLYSYDYSLGNTLLSGDKVLCEASPSDTLSLITDDLTGESHYYLHAWNDAASGLRRCVIYNELGAEVLSFDNEVGVWLTGNYLKVYNDSGVYGDYDLNEPGSIRLFDLSTQEDGSIKGEIPIPENAVECTPMLGYIAYTIYDMPEGVTNIYDDEQRYAHCSVQIQDEAGNIVYEDTACDASTIYVSNSHILPGWINIRYYDGTDFEAYRSVLYRPSDGKTLENFVQTCGGATASFINADGKYELRDISGTDTTILAESDGKWFCDYIPGLAILTGSDYNYVMRDLASGAETGLRSFCYTNDMLAVLTSDLTLICYDRESGEQISSTQVSFSGEAENGYSLYSLTGEYFWLQKFGGANTSSEIQVYDRSGFVADLTPLTERYDNISDLAVTDSGLLLACSYTGPGKTSLYDVVDCAGNVVQSGLGICYEDFNSDLPDGCFIARRGYYYGWMDSDGSWIYCKSVFSSFSADDSTYLY